MQLNVLNDLAEAKRRWTEKNNKKRRPANVPARFPFRQQRKQRTQHKTGPEPHQTIPHKPMGIASRHDRVMPTVSKNMQKTKEESVRS